MRLGEVKEREEEGPQTVTRMRAHLKGEPLSDGRMVVVVRANVSSALGITGREVIPCKLCQWDVIILVRGVERIRPTYREEHNTLARQSIRG